MNFLQGLSAGVDVNVDISVGGSAQMSSAAQMQTIAASSTVVEKVTTTSAHVDVSSLQTDIEKYKKESINLKEQLKKLNEIISKQSKEISVFKQQKAAQIQSQTTTMITTTTSATDAAKIAELQRAVNEWVEENKRDDKKILEQDVMIQQQVLDIERLNKAIEYNTLEYRKEIAALNEKLKRAHDSLKASEGDDVSDKTKIFNLNNELQELKIKINLVEQRYQSSDTEVKKIQADYEAEITLHTEAKSKIVTLTNDLNSTKEAVEDKDREIERMKRNQNESDAEIVKLKVENENKVKLTKELNIEIDSCRDREKKAKDASKTYIIKLQEAEEKAKKLEIQVNSQKNLLGDFNKARDVMVAKITSLEKLNGVLQSKNLELEDIFKRTDKRLKEEEAKDIEDIRQIKELTEKVAEFGKVIEDYKRGDVAEHTQIKVLNEQLTALNAQMKIMQTKQEEQAKIINEKVVIIDRKNAIIMTLKKIMIELKGQLEKAHSLSLSFQIKKEERVEEREAMTASVKVSAEYKRLELEVTGNLRAIEAREAKITELIAENEKIVKELAAVRAEFEVAAKKCAILEAQLKSDQSEMVSLKAHQAEINMSASVSMEKEKSFFKSAEESVTTYREEINHTFNEITGVVTQIEEQLV